MSTKTQIFSEYQLRAELKKYLHSEITRCDEQIGECKLLLTSDIRNIDREELHRKLEIIMFRRFWLFEQTDAINGAELNEYINRKNK